MIKVGDKFVAKEGMVFINSHGLLERIYADGFNCVIFEVAEIYGSSAASTTKGQQFFLSDVEANLVKPEVWKPEEIKWPGYYTISGDGEVTHTPGRLHTIYISSGFCRPTKESARKFFDGTVKPMALIALRAFEIDPEWTADWNDPRQEKWSLFFNHSKNNWMRESCVYSQAPGTPYMAKSTADQIFEELKSGFLQVGVL